MQRFLDLFISINCSACFSRFLRLSSGAQNCTYSVRYCQTNTAAIVDETEPRSISSTIAAGSSIGLTIPDAVCTVLCSCWWVEEPPETCTAIYRNKQIKKNVASSWLYFKDIQRNITMTWTNYPTVRVIEDTVS